MKRFEALVNTPFKKPKARKVVDGKIEVYDFVFSSEWLKDNKDGQIVNVLSIINNGDATFTAVLSEGAGIPGRRLDRPPQPKKEKVGVKPCTKPHLEKSEYEAYQRLLEWTDSAKPLALLTYIIEAKRTDTGWRVPSKGGVGFYDIPEDLSACSPKCDGFRARKYCNHLKAMALRSQIEFKPGKVLEDEPIEIGEDGLPF